MADWNLFVHPDTVDAGVSAGIRRKGFCCRETSRFLRHSVHELEQQNRSSGRIVALDIGANIGYHTVELGKLGCRVVAWELLPLNFRVLAANVRVHNLGGSVELVPRGASEGPSRAVVARMYERSTGMTTIGGGALPTAWKMDEVKGERLQVAPASDELARLGLPRVDLVKIGASPHSYAICPHLTPRLPRVRRRGARDGSFAGTWALAAPPRRALPAHRDLPAATRSQRSLRRRLPALPASAGPALLHALRQAAPSP